MSVSDTELNRPELERDDRLQQSHVLRRVLQRPEVGAIIGAGALWLYFAIVAGDSGFLSARGTASYLEVSAQLGILALTLLLAVPTGRRPRRVRAEHGTIDDPATTFAEDDDD